MQTRDVAEAWDANAEVWARHVRAGYDTYRDLYNNPAFFEFVGDVNGLTILDAGCGEGYNTRLLARRGARMTGCDISPKLITLAREEEAREPLGIGYEVVSMGDLSPFDDASLNAVFSTMALMDCDCYEEAMREFWRVLHPGGMLAFSIVHPCFSYRNTLGWERDSEGEIVGIRLGDYFQPGPYEETWRFGAAPVSEEVRPFTIVYSNRTLTETLNPILGAGFLLDSISEPRPSLEACEKAGGLRKHRLIPGTLLVKARKPK